MKCPKCELKTFVKTGFIREKQRFLCKNCGCQFTQDFVGKYGQNIKLQTLKLYKEGNGFRRIGRILGVSFEIGNRGFKTAKKLFTRLEQNYKIDSFATDHLSVYYQTIPKKTHNWQEIFIIILNLLMPFKTIILNILICQA